MIINKVSSSANYYSSITATRYTSAANAIRGVQKAERFTLSKEAQSFNDMLKKLKNMPEVREDKVSAIQEKISSGEYFISADNIALSLLTNRY